MIFNAGTTPNNSEEIAAMLTEFISEVNNTLTGFKSEINTMLTDVSADVTALNTNVNTVKSNVSTLSSTVSSIPKGAVRSVQRGILPAGTSTTKYDVLSVSSGVNWAYYVDVTISAVTNLNKCFVYADSISLAIPKLVNATTLRLYINSGSGEYTSYLNGSAISWQVVEFY